MATIEYIHVDVFSRTAYGGNSLPVFPEAIGLSAQQMLRITQELRHFEAIFLQPAIEPNRVRARIFDLWEELPFAGHPIIGAAAVLHHASGCGGTQTWCIELTSKNVSIVSKPTASGYFGVLDQGAPGFFGTVDLRETFARAFCLESHDLNPDLPLEVVSTGLRYLIVPVRSGALERAHIRTGIADLLIRVKAQFAVLLDESALEIRHWNNDGIVEDVATGSAAGTIGAYRLRHRLAEGNKTFILNQRRFTGRASTLRVQPEGTPENIKTVKVGGDLAFVGHGSVEVLP